MLRRDTSPPQVHVPPAAALPCVWMSAGLVAFKLCDREGECEGCPFDQAMRGLGASPPVEEAAPRPLSPWAFPAGRRYHAGHAWEKPVGAGRLRIGVDALAARLWNRPSGVILPAAGSRLDPGETACWLEDGAELLPIPSPVRGTVVARNAGVLADPSLIVRSPYDAGWLFEVKGREEGVPLLAADEARKAAEATLASFTAAAARALGRGRDDVGPTLPDGGERLIDLRSMLGPPRYAALIRRFLSLRAGRK